jgi:hypothetical protein
MINLHKWRFAIAVFPALVFAVMVYAAVLANFSWVRIARLSLLVQCEKPSISLRWFTPSTPVIGPEFQASRPIEMAEYDKGLTAWDSEHSISPIVSTRLLAVCKRPTIIVKQNRYTCTGTDWELEVSYWIVLGIIALFQAPMGISIRREVATRLRSRRRGFAIGEAKLLPAQRE